MVVLMLDLNNDSQNKLTFLECNTIIIVMSVANLSIFTSGGSADRQITANKIDGNSVNLKGR